MEKPGKKIYRKTLKTLGQVREYLAALINDHRQGKLEDKFARTQGFLCNILLEAIKSSDIEKRLEELEMKIL